MQSDPFRTLADPTRRRIVEALRSGEHQVGDIVVQAGIHQSGVSRHLGILLEAGFVSMRPDGQRRLYALRPEPFRQLDQWLAMYRGLWEARLDRLGDTLEQRRKGRGAAHKEKPGPHARRRVHQDVDGGLLQPALEAGQAIREATEPAAMPSPSAPATAPGAGGADGRRQPRIRSG